MRKMLRWILGTLLFIIGLGLLTLIAILLLLRGNLPTQDGTLQLSGITNTVSIERDEWGIPTITAANRDDVAYALGFLHAQERFFQMDLNRRSASGELAALFGPSLVEYDKSQRIHAFREKAIRAYDRLSPEQKAYLDSYVQGVNQGLNALKVRPFEYLLLRTSPEPWTAEDSLLQVYAFYSSMQSQEPAYRQARALVQEKLPPAIAEFMLQEGLAWDATLDGKKAPILPIPPVDAWSFLSNSETPDTPTQLPTEPQHPGSNSFAVGTDLSSFDKPILANDPHLAVMVPSTWYKATTIYPGPDGQALQVNGFTLPGLPVIVIGQTQHISWGLTNGYTRSCDIIRLIPVEDDSSHYLTPDGEATLLSRQELIEVKGGQSVTTTVEYTPWGPVIGEDHNGDKLVLKWAAYHPDAVSLDTMDIETATTAEEVLDQANRSNICVQNILATDSKGSIGWSLYGFVPDHGSGSKPDIINSTDAGRIWKNRLAPETYPRLINPADERLWTANNRILGDEAYHDLGDAGFAEFPRAFQIRERLFAEDRFSPEAMADIQHDSEAIILKRWYAIIQRHLGATSAQDQSALLQEFAAGIKDFDAWAMPDSISYTLVREFRIRVRAELMKLIFRDCIEIDDKFLHRGITCEEPLYQLANQQPEFLKTYIGSWDTLFEQCIEDILKDVTDINQLRWGNKNPLRIRHPLSMAVPLLAPFLDMPTAQVDGDVYTPKVVFGNHTASMRMVAIPGDADDSVFQMPGGQSGNPLSSHYSDLHKLWLTKDYLPLQPGDTESTLTLEPAN